MSQTKQLDMISVFLLVCWVQCSLECTSVAVRLCERVCVCVQIGNTHATNSSTSLTWPLVRTHTYTLTERQGDSFTICTKPHMAGAGLGFKFVSSKFSSDDVPS